MAEVLSSTIVGVCLPSAVSLSVLAKLAFIERAVPRRLLEKPSVAVSWRVFGVSILPIASNNDSQQLIFESH